MTNTRLPHNKLLKYNAHVVTSVPKTIVKLTAHKKVNDLFWTS